jgi:hypothetical protein
MYIYIYIYIYIYVIIYVNIYAFKYLPSSTTKAVLFPTDLVSPESPQDLFKTETFKLKIIYISVI